MTLPASHRKFPLSQCEGDGHTNFPSPPLGERAWVRGNRTARTIEALH